MLLLKVKNFSKMTIATWLGAKGWMKKVYFHDGTEKQPELKQYWAVVDYRK